MGILPGTSLASARARLSTLKSLALEPERLRDAERVVVRDLLGLTPRISALGASRFLVEVPCDDLEEFCARARALLRDRGRVSIGVGSDATIAVAAALSAPDGARIVSDAEARAFLEASPLEALELPCEALDVLASLGVRTVAQLLRFSPTSLGMRFGPAVAGARRRLDGLDPRRPTTRRVPDEHLVTVALDQELDRVDALAFVLAPAAARLFATLRGQALGASSLSLRLRLRGGGAHDLLVRAASPLTDARTALELLRERLDRAQTSAPATGFELRAKDVVPSPPRSGDLFHGPGRDPGAREAAIERLRGRIGDDRVARASHVQAASPLERAVFTRGAEAEAGEALPWRRMQEPAPVQEGRALVAGRSRRVLRVGRVERVTGPWWEDGEQRVVLHAWAELEGPLLALLRARCSTGCDDRWEVLAWLD